MKPHPPLLIALLLSPAFTALAAESPWPAPVPGFVAPKSGGGTVAIGAQRVSFKDGGIALGEP